MITLNEALINAMSKDEAAEAIASADFELDGQLPRDLVDQLLPIHRIHFVGSSRAYTSVRGFASYTIGNILQGCIVTLRKGAKNLRLIENTATDGFRNPACHEQQLFFVSIERFR
ncbi:hypothetical protein [Rosistilla oblonga]|uniref:hypothetical protein n=1 Tax=Rosistilla oblonga TaxID=2527990 RepID=UPI001E41A4E0|nr:hypothetical protein [Rosistilla oblonga]